MARVKRGVTAHARHKKMLGMAKGYKHGRKSLFRQAKQAVIRAGQYSYRDRKVNKRRFRQQWIISINAAARLQGISYSQFMAGLKKSNTNLNRKMLAELAQNESSSFTEIADKAKATINQ